MLKMFGENYPTNEELSAEECARIFIGGLSQEERTSIDRVPSRDKIPTDNLVGKDQSSIE